LIGSLEDRERPILSRAATVINFLRLPPDVASQEVFREASGSL
jgi:hypothetical protein